MRLMKLNQKEGYKMEKIPDNAVGFTWFNGNICLVIWWNKDGFTGLLNDQGTPVYGCMQANICSVASLSQESDIQQAIDWGGSFPLYAAEVLIDECGGWTKPDKLSWRPREETNSPLKLKLKYKSES